MISDSQAGVPGGRARIRPAAVAFNDDALYSTEYGDIYHTADGAIEESRHVFLAGNALPQRWQESASFTIVETGFGCGLNFLTTWDEWQRCGAGCRLDYVSVEKHPFTADDLAALLRAWPQFEPLSRELLDQYPPLIAGFHRLYLDQGRVCLTLLFGDAADMLAELDARADALYLDGFAPAKNPDIWSPELFEQLRRISAPGTTAATYSAAAQVRDGLRAAGFVVEKKPGFGRKRDMLRAQVPGTTPHRPRRRKVVVIGAGIAGVSCAFALARRGIEVELLDRESTVGRGNSANPAAVVRPFPTLDTGARNRFGWAAFLYAVRLYGQLSQSVQCGWRQTGVLQLARGSEDRDKLARAIDLHGYPPDLVRPVERYEASALCGATITDDGLWFSLGGFVAGPLLCSALAASFPQHIRFHGGICAQRVSVEDGIAHIYDVDNRVIASADMAILANGIDAQALIPGGAPWLGAIRGQVTEIAVAAAAMRAPVCRDGYVTPPIAGHHYVGATYDKTRTEPILTNEDHALNLHRAAGILPGVFAVQQLDVGSGWTAVRCASRDRLPVVGEIAPNLYCCIAMGSRGFSWAPLAAEVLASCAAGAPSPLERAVSRCLAALRFSRDASRRVSKFNSR